MEQQQRLKQKQKQKQQQNLNQKHHQKTQDASTKPEPETPPENTGRFHDEERRGLVFAGVISTRRFDVCTSAGGGATEGRRSISHDARKAVTMGKRTEAILPSRNLSCVSISDSVSTRSCDPVRGLMIARCGRYFGMYIDCRRFPSLYSSLEETKCWTMMKLYCMISWILGL